MRSALKRRCVCARPEPRARVIAVSVGPQQAQETIRTALAMGADRGILVKPTTYVEPLAVAKILKAIVDEEKPDPGYSRQTGHRRRLQSDRPDAGRAARVVAGDLRLRDHPIDGSEAEVTREIDGGLQTLKVKTAVHRHHRPAPQRAALRIAAEHHEGQEKADRREKPGRLRRRCDAAPEGLNTTEPPKREAGSRSDRSANWSTS